LGFEYNVCLGNFDSIEVWFKNLAQWFSRDAQECTGADVQPIECKVKLLTRPHRQQLWVQRQSKVVGHKQPILGYSAQAYTLPVEGQILCCSWPLLSGWLVGMLIDLCDPILMSKPHISVSPVWRLLSWWKSNEILLTYQQSLVAQV
jgi:hypothetical protein